MKSVDSVNRKRSNAEQSQEKGDLSPDKKIKQDIKEESHVAIIVPFRDVHAEQKRQVHLDQFIPHMTDLLSQCPLLKSFHIFIIEQSNDDRKFNRGKLLNAGFDLAQKMKFNIFIFHDVDLLPSHDLGRWYSTIPTCPTHIASVWDRYNSNAYFGGVVSFNAQDFINVNGYPNNFWGWGGEDDELYNRVITQQLKILSLPMVPPAGTIVDLEQMDLHDKLSILREKKWKCMVKWDLLQEHRQTWQSNGLQSLAYTETQRQCLSEHCTKITIDLGLNNHWSDHRTDWTQSMPVSTSVTHT